MKFQDNIHLMLKKEKLRGVARESDVFANKLFRYLHMKQLYFTVPQWLKLPLEAGGRPPNLFVLIYFRLHLNCQYMFLGQ